MATLGEVLDALEGRSLTGRERELRLLSDWLRTDAALPQVLNLTGPAGIGKSALLREFHRRLAAEGRRVLLVDGRALPPTPAALLRALGGDDLDEVVQRLNEVRPVVLVDSVERAAGLAEYCMDVLLPSVHVDVRVVIAGRHPVAATDLAAPWARLVRPLRLESLSAQESRCYLTRRGVTDPGLVGQIWTLTRGYPLGLAVAADAVVHLGVRDFAVAAERHLLVRSLVETLLAEVTDPVLRELLEVLAVVREVDQSLLEDLAGHPAPSGSFERLCRTSVVRLTRHGLTLPEHVATLVAEDLLWRRPDRHRELRRRASGLIRERLAIASPPDRERLTRDRLRLLACPAPETLHSLGEVGRVDEGARTDHLAFRSLSHGWRPSGVGRDWLAVDGSRLRVVRDGAGRITAGVLVVPICRRTLPELTSDPALGPALRRSRAASPPEPLPLGPEGASGFCLVDVRSGPAAGEAATRALWRDVIALLARGGVSVAVPPRNSSGDRDLHRLLQLGFRPVHGDGPGVEAEPHVLALDVARVGLVAWQDLVLDARRPRVSVTSAELVAELRTLLPRWHDDAALADSTLAALAAVPSDASDASAADAARQLTATALARTREASPDSALAYKALDLAFLTRIGSHERVAERLAVSRSTLYRLLRRAEEGLSLAILSTPPVSQEPS